MNETEQAVVQWLRGKPFRWPTPTPFLDRLRSAWAILRHGDQCFHSVFQLLAMKIERGEHKETDGE